MNEDIVSQITGPCVIISDTNIAKFYRKKIEDFFQGFPAHFFFLPPGEETKNFRQVEQILHCLLEKKCDRSTTIFAFGGGVILDLVGFIASIYLRGVDFISIPTTFLAMVDAAVGGKTGVNTDLGKNLIGSFYPAKKIVYLPEFLHTLPKKHLRSGLVEAIKHALIYDKDLFTFFLENQEKIFSLDLDFLQKIIPLARKIKEDIVQKDLYDKGLRKIVNFGHTIGHAIECAENYQILHGHAVAMGILVESYLSKEKNILSYKDFATLVSAFNLFGLSFHLSENFCRKTFIEALLIDKKNNKNKIHCVLLEKIGKTYRQENSYSFPLERQDIEKAINWMEKQYACRCCRRS